MNTVTKRLALGMLVAVATALTGPIATGSIPAYAAALSAEGEDAADAPVISWAVSPASETARDGRAWVEANVAAGTTFTEHLSLHNLSDVPATFSLTAADGYFTPTGRFSMLSADTPSTQSGTWISVTDRVSLAAGEQIILPFTVSVPANATPGDHAAGIAASIHSEGTSADGTSVGVDSRVGFRVLTRVDGELAPRLDLAKLAASYETNWNPFGAGTVRVDWSAMNEGNTRLTAASDITISSFGVPITSTPGVIDGTELLPGDERRLSATVSQAWPLGPLTVAVAAYPAAVPDGDEDFTPVVRTFIVWALPWPQALVLLALLLIVGSLVLGRRRQHARIEQLVAAAHAQGVRDAEQNTPSHPSKERR